MLTGACMSRAGLNRKTGLATATLVLAAEASDLDVFYGIHGRVAALQHHRGWTHSFVAVPVMAALTLLVVWAWNRLFRKRRRDPNAAGTVGRKHPPVRWGVLYGIALLGPLSHILLDYTTAYGIRMFAPFEWRWYSWDIVFIVEPVILVALIAGLVLPSLFGLINQEIGARSKGPRGRAGAIFALVCLVLVWGQRDYQHRRALNAMGAVLYQGAVPVKYAAYPYWVNPFRWHGVVETEAQFQTVPVDSRKPEVDEQGQAHTYFKPEETPVTQVAKESYLGRAYLDWAVFPVTLTEKLQGAFPGYLVRFQDLRFAYPEMRGRGTLSGWVLLGPDLRVQEEGMNSRKASVEQTQ